MSERFDLVVIGAGAAGIPAAIFAARAGAQVLLVDAADKIGGTFHLSSGHMSAAGTRLQAAKGISDTPDAHYADVMRINGGSADPALVRLAVDNAADTLHWLLDNGLEVVAGHPIIYKGHEGYTVPRTYWGPEAGRSVLKVLAPLLEAEIAAGGVTLWLETRMEALLRGGDGDVCGVRVRDGAASRDVTAGAVLLATGGYTASAAAYAALNPGVPLYSGGYPTAQGDGIFAAQELGAAVVGRGAYLPIFACVSSPGAVGGYANSTCTNPLIRMPWEIFVNDRGERFFAEDQPSCDHREHALAEQPGLRFWVVYDEAIRLAAPPLFGDAALAALFGEHPDYVVANSLAALAEQTGMDADVLAATVARYNDGSADAMGRTHKPAAVGTGPFYAVRHFGWSITSFAGVGVDGELRVVDEAGVPIGNLYAAGEVLGFGQTSGTAFCSGMSVTPAMTFGRMLGARLGAELLVEA